MKRNIYADALIRVLIIFVLSFFICGLITALCSCTRKIENPAGQAGLNRSLQTLELGGGDCDA